MTNSKTGNKAKKAKKVQCLFSLGILFKKPTDNTDRNYILHNIVHFSLKIRRVLNCANKKDDIYQRITIGVKNWYSTGHRVIT
jgi:hypothetical protein